MFKLFAFLFFFTSSFPYGSVSSRGMKFYLKLGESNIITNKNVSIALNATRRDFSIIEIETCPSCIIFIKFPYINFRDNCMKISNSPYTNCKCGYIWIAEWSYEEMSGTPFCGYWNAATSYGKSDPSYRSQTKSVIINFLYVDSELQEFVMYFASEIRWNLFEKMEDILENRKFLNGNPQNSNGRIPSGGFISSPFFPANYPRDLVSEYVMSCIKYPYMLRHTKYNNINPNMNCTIRLVFTDFQLASLSVIEFFDGNQERIALSSGSSFRPPLIITNSSRLRVRFTANGGEGFGFKARFSFTQGNVNSLLEPNINCGGLVEDLGGAITMVNMVSTGTKAFDCIWLISPPENFIGINGFIYVKVNAFKNFGGDAELEIRDGLFSESPLLERTLYNSRRSKGLVTSVASGFYINLKALFEPSSVLGITFTTFHYNSCFAGPEFLCLNHRCVPSKVVCDCFDHCGDNSDENEICYKGCRKSENSSRKWDSLTSNYYFPKVEHFSELKTAAIVFIVSSLGLIFFLIVLFILLYRMGSTTRRQTDYQRRLHTISEFLDDASIEEMIDDEPPTYEAPPDYEAAIKETIRSSKEVQINVLGEISQAPGISSGETKIVLIVPEGLPSSTTKRLSHEKLSNYKHFESSTKQLPSSPPPPYVEDENILTGQFTSAEQCIEVSVSNSFPCETLNDPDRSSSSVSATDEECSQVRMDEYGRK